MLILVLVYVECRPAQHLAVTVRSGRYDMSPCTCLTCLLAALSALA